MQLETHSGFGANGEGAETYAWTWLRMNHSQFEYAPGSARLVSMFKLRETRAFKNTFMMQQLRSGVLVQGLYWRSLTDTEQGLLKSMFLNSMFIFDSTTAYCWTPTSIGGSPTA